MSQDAVSAVTWATTDPLDRYRAQSQPLDLSKFDPSANGAHLSVAGPITEQVLNSGMNVRSIYSAFQVGMQKGFIAPETERLRLKLEASQQPGSTITPGELTADLVVATGKVAMAEIFAKLSSKLGEGLQTVVVKQG